jgi:hypothetical protein
METSMDANTMTIPTTSEPKWVLVRIRDASPALARLTGEKWPGSYIGSLMVVEMNQTRGVWEYRVRRPDYPISTSSIVHVFPCAPSPAWVAEARRALRRKQT